MLVTPKIKVPLLYHLRYLAGLIIAVMCKIYSYIGVIDCSSPLADFIASSNTMRASAQARGFQGSFSSVLPRPMSEVCNVFRNRALPSTLWKVTKSRGSSTCHFE